MLRVGFFIPEKLEYLRYLAWPLHIPQLLLSIKVQADASIPKHV